MGINLSVKTNKKACLKLYNQINSFIFEQECDELKGKSEATQALIKAKQALFELIKR